MLGKQMLIIAFAALVGGVGGALACDLKLEPSQTFGGACQVVVGYDGATRVGPFRRSFPDGTMAHAGTCEGYQAVRKIEGNVLTLEAFHTAPARIFTLSQDCRNATSKSP
jgi:hypothetical protein